MNLPILCKICKKKEVYAIDIFNAIHALFGAFMLIMLAYGLSIEIWELNASGNLHTLPSAIFNALVQCKRFIIGVILITAYCVILNKSTKVKIAECPLNKKDGEEK